MRGGGERKSVSPNGGRRDSGVVACEQCGDAMDVRILLDSFWGA